MAWFRLSRSSVVSDFCCWLTGVELDVAYLYQSLMCCACGDVFSLFSFCTISCKHSRPLCENLRMSAVSEILKAAHPAPAPGPQSDTVDHFLTLLFYSDRSRYTFLLTYSLK